MFGIRAAIPATSRLNVIKYANLASLLQTNELLGNYRNLFWFGSPIGLPLVEWTAAVVYGGVLTFAFCWVFARAQLLSASKRGFLLGLRHKTHATSVYKEEARKLLLLNGAALVLAAFAGFGIYQGVTAESYIGPDEIYYAYYMKHTSGPFTQESYDWLEEQGEEFAPMLEVQRKVAAGELSSDAMLAFSSLQQKYSVYSRVINQNINYYLKEHPGAWLVYESGYKELFGFTGDADVQDTLLAGLACALCFSGLFSMERRGGMETILCTTPLGRKRTVRAKLAVSAGVAVLIAAASCLPHLIQVLRDYGLPALFAPAMSISEFESLPALFTLSDVLLFWFVCRIAACLCMGAITLTLGRVFGNLLPALFVSAVGYCLPALLSLSGMDGGIEWLGFWPLFHAANFFTTQGYAGEEGLPYNNAWVILLLLVVVLLGTATLWGYLRDCYDRSWMPPVEQDALIYGPIRVELLTHKVLAQGKFVHLAKMEYRLLCYLILHEGQVLSRQEILTNIWNLPPNVKTRTLDMHIHTLRKKLGLADYLETVLQVGYRLRSIGKKEESPR